MGLSCKRALSKRLHSAKETYNFEEFTNRSHSIILNVVVSSLFSKLSKKT